MSLPSGYKRLEYIHSTGKQYIDTGFKPNQNTRVIMDVKLLSQTTANIGIFGVRDRVTANEAKKFIAWSMSTGSSIRSDYFGTYSNVLQSTSIVGNRIILDKNKNICKFGSVVLTNTSATGQCTKSIYLLCTNDGGTPNYHATANLYSCQIYDNGTLVRDFVPCKTTAGEIGLWDDINSVFYGNVGTGTFTAGSVVDPYGNDENTLLLLHGEDLADSSPYNKSITNNGVSISSAQSKFGGKSLYFNGSSNLSIDLPVTGDMTVDFWAYIQDSSISFPTPFGWDYNGNRCNYVHTLPSVTWFAQNDGRDSIEVSTNGIAHNAWHHIALVRSGKQMLGFIDGVLKTTSSVNYGNNDILSIGVLNAAKSATWFTGFIDEFRVSSIARWTVDFTPPSKPYSSSLNLPVNIGGTWKKANEAFVNIGGTWKTVKDAFVNIGGAWKKIG